MLTRVVRSGRVARAGLVALAAAAALTTPPTGHARDGGPIVRVERIAVKEVGTSDDRTVASLDLTVVSKNPANVTQMMDEMQRGGVFQAELVSQNLQRGRDEIGAEYEMNVRYTPRAGMPIDASEKASRPVDTATGIRSKPQ